jgi:hypothetical protein
MSGSKISLLRADNLEFNKTYQSIDRSYAVMSLPAGVSRINGILHAFQPFTVVEKDKTISGQPILKIKTKDYNGFIHVDSGALFE